MYIIVVMQKGYSQFAVSVLGFLLLWAVLTPCVFFTHAGIDHMDVAMQTMSDSKCCFFQPLPDLHVTLQSTIVNEVFRNTFLSLLFSIGVFVLVQSGIRSFEKAYLSHMRTYTLMLMRCLLSGFERMFQRGIVQSLLYEPAFSLS